MPDSSGMFDSGIRVNDGDYLLMIAEGEIDISPRVPVDYDMGGL